MKRKLNGKPIAIILGVILILLSLYKIPHFINVSKLEKLGYSEEAIAAIYKKGLRNDIIKNSYYTDYLNEEVTKDTFRKEYLRLYTVREGLTEETFYLYDRLRSLKGYSDDELVSLFRDLPEYDLVPLTVFEKVPVEDYIADAGSFNNSETSFTVSGDYLKEYENVMEVADPSAVDTYVSRKYSVGQYTPEKIAAVSSMNAVPDVYLESRALEAFDKLCNGARENGTAIYAVAAYRSYESIQEAHSTYGGGKEADKLVTRPGFADVQLGLSVSVVASENESAALFTETQAYHWLMENAHKYGFIQRYPEGKEVLTGEAYQANYFRFVGEELAKKIYESGLTFDEYFAMYIR